VSKTQNNCLTGKAPYKSAANQHFLADFEGMAAQDLGALSGLYRQKISQHASGNTMRHQGGKMRSQLVELRGSTDNAKPRCLHLRGGSGVK